MAILQPPAIIPARQQYTDYALSDGNTWWSWWDERTEQPMGCPDEGWKLHIGGTKDNAERILNAVAPRLQRLEIHHKFARDTDILDTANGTQAGKWFVAYPWSLAHAIQATCAIDQVLAGLFQGAGHQDLTEPVPGDRPVGQTVVYTRYGQFKRGSYILGADRGRPVVDNRSQSRPSHVADPWPVCRGLLAGAPPPTDRLPVALREQFPVYTSAERAAFDRLEGSE